MSQTDQEDTLKCEIQKILMQIDEDMNKLKNELVALNNLIQENSALPMTAEMLNAKLMEAAKDAGIDLETIGGLGFVESDEEDFAGSDDDSQELNETPVGEGMPSQRSDSSDNEEEAAGSSNIKNSKKESESLTKSNASALSNAGKKLKKTMKRVHR